MATQCNLYDTVTLEHALEYIQKYAAENPANEREWIVGRK